jgi:hypothetical protein
LPLLVFPELELPALVLPVLPLVLLGFVFEPLFVLLELLVLPELDLLLVLLDVLRLPVRSPDCRFVVVVLVSVVPELDAVPELLVLADEPARSAAELPTPGVGLFTTSPVEPGSLGKFELPVPLVALPGPAVALPGPPVALPGPGVSVACPLPPELFAAPVALLEFV